LPTERTTIIGDMATFYPAARAKRKLGRPNDRRTAAPVTVTSGLNVVAKRPGECATCGTRHVSGDEIVMTAPYPGSRAAWRTLCLMCAANVEPPRGPGDP
jgi:hypothetical protein